MNPLQQLENAPKNLVLYFLGLVGAVVDDYTLVTLTIFCVLLGFVLHSVLIPVTVFFGLYLAIRLVGHVSDAIGANAQTQNNLAQATLQIAAALAQFNPPQGTDVNDTTLLP